MPARLHLPPSSSCDPADGLPIEPASSVSSSGPHGFTQALPSQPQCLFLRLLQRRGPLVRVSSLSYPEVGDARAAAGHLEALGIAHLLEAIDDWEPFVQVGLNPQAYAAARCAG